MNSFPHQLCITKISNYFTFNDTFLLTDGATTGKTLIQMEDKYCSASSHEET